MIRRYVAFSPIPERGHPLLTGDVRSGWKSEALAMLMKATPDRRIPEPGSIRPALHKVSPPGLFRGSKSDARRFLDLALDCRNKSGNDDRKEGSFDGARPGLAPLFLVPDRNHFQASSRTGVCLSRDP